MSHAQSNFVRVAAVKDVPEGAPKAVKVEGRSIALFQHQGNIYATAGSGDQAGVYVFSPQGKQLTFIKTPEDPTNCAFGGPDRSTLYITAGQSLYRIRLNARGRLIYPLLKQ